MTPEERKILEDAENQAFETAAAFWDSPTSGIRPPPSIEETETVLEPELFGFEFGQQPEAEVEPFSFSGGGEPTCCSIPTLACDQISASKTKCGYAEFTDPTGCPGPSSPPKIYLHRTVTASSSRCHTDTIGEWTEDPATCVSTPLTTDHSGAWSCDDTRHGDFVFDPAFCPQGCTGTECDGDFDCFPDCGTITWTQDNEYTTAMLISNTEAALPAYDDSFTDPCQASRDLSADELTYSIKRFRYKFICD